MSENEEKVMALMALAANFGKEFPECLLPIWLDLLAPYPASLVNKGVKQVILSYEYKTIPPFAVLKGILDKIVGHIPEEERLALAAEAEWNKLLADIHSRGRYDPPKLCPTTAFVLRSMGGWQTACSWETHKTEWRHKEFLEAWKMAHGKEELMELGATAVMAIESSGRIKAVGSVCNAQIQSICNRLPQGDDIPVGECHANAE